MRGLITELNNKVWWNGLLSLLMHPLFLDVHWWSVFFPPPTAEVWTLPTAVPLSRSEPVGIKSYSLDGRHGICSTLKHILDRLRSYSCYKSIWMIIHSEMPISHSQTLSIMIIYENYKKPCLEIRIPNKLYKFMNHFLSQFMSYSGIKPKNWHGKNQWETTMDFRLTLMKGWPTKIPRIRNTRVGKPAQNALLPWKMELCWQKNTRIHFVSWKC